jgi:hypothetical protein
MNNMNIEQFIARERDYFKPMLERKGFYSKEILEAFGKETVRERKLRVSTEVYDMCGGYVATGPFKDMKLSKSSWLPGLDLGSMCLGLYERGLLDSIVEEFNNSGRQLFIDIGAADGYYAIGLLNAQLVSKAICFELRTISQESIINNWKVNNEPGSIEVYGDVLKNFDKIYHSENQNAVILIDIEGVEFELFKQIDLKYLQNAVIYIEIHNWVDNFDKEYEEFLITADEYFDITAVEPKLIDINDISMLRSLPDDNRYSLFSESRPCLMRFLKLTPKNKLQ